MRPIIPVKKLHPDAVLPSYQSDGAAGMDLCAIDQWLTLAGESLPVDLDSCNEQPRTLYPGQSRLFGTGIALAIPPGFEGQIRPRSGLAAKRGITVLNSPGTIDSDYRGEVKVLLINLGDEPYAIKRGDRIAQIVFAPVARAELQQVDDLDATARGSGGFGSTGTTVRCMGSWSMGNNCKSCWHCQETAPGRHGVDL